MAASKQTYTHVNNAVPLVWGSLRLAPKTHRSHRIRIQYTICIASKRDKMASGAMIRVCVLEGLYAQLSNLGFPVSLAVELQQGGLCLDNAKWSSRLSDAGFLVSFFWPSHVRLSIVGIGGEGSQEPTPTLGTSELLS